MKRFAQVNSCVVRIIIIDFNVWFQQTYTNFRDWCLYLPLLNVIINNNHYTYLNAYSFGLVGCSRRLEVAEVHKPCASFYFYRNPNSEFRSIISFTTQRFLYIYIVGYDFKTTGAWKSCTMSTSTTLESWVWICNSSGTARAVADFSTVTS